jgi:hypothetical protein
MTYITKQNTHCFISYKNTDFLPNSVVTPLSKNGGNKCFVVTNILFN